MGYNTASTIWPSVPPAAGIKALVDELFAVLDSDEKDAGEQLADHIFAPDGIFVGPAGPFEGSESIRKCRDGAWTIVKKRRHIVLRVYLHDQLDILLIGQVQMLMMGGKEVAGEFTARLILVEDGFGRPKVKLYQAWADSAPFTKAMEESVRESSYTS